MNKSEIEHYWYAFLSSLPANSKYFGKNYVAEGFGDNPELADELGQLIVSGKKTGTCSCIVGVGSGGESHSPSLV